MYSVSFKSDYSISQLSQQLNSPSKGYFFIKRKGKSKNNPPLDSVDETGRKRTVHFQQMKKLLSFEELRKNKVNIGSSRNKRQRNVVRVEQIGSAIMYSFGIAIFL